MDTFTNGWLLGHLSAAHKTLNECQDLLRVQGHLTAAKELDEAFYAINRAENLLRGVKVAKARKAKKS